MSRIASRVARLEQDREEGLPWWAGLPFEEWPLGAALRFIREVEGWPPDHEMTAEQWRDLLGADDDGAAP
jgi:hypothetical protein